jgi:uncharacterized protein YlaN (UPF0358 family)
MKRTPKTEHARLKKENEKLLKLIGAELENRMPENPHYGDVGDLEHTKKLLIEILCFQRDAFDELEIEKELLD